MSHSLKGVPDPCLPADKVLEKVVASVTAAKARGRDVDDSNCQALDGAVIESLTAHAADPRRRIMLEC